MINFYLKVSSYFLKDHRWEILKLFSKFFDADNRIFLLEEKHAKESDIIIIEVALVMVTTS